MDDATLGFTMCDLVHRLGKVAGAADRRPVRITRHGRPLCLMKAGMVERNDRMAPGC